MFFSNFVLWKFGFHIPYTVEELQHFKVEVVNLHRTRNCNEKNQVSALCHCILAFPQSKGTEMAFYHQFMMKSTVPQLPCWHYYFELINTSWVQLTDTSLLRKCVQGVAQNRDELWCWMLRDYVPRASFEVVMLSTVSAATCCCPDHFKLSCGLGGYSIIMEEMGWHWARFHALQDGDYTWAWNTVKGTDKVKNSKEEEKKVKERSGDSAQTETEARRVFGPGVADGECQLKHTSNWCTNQNTCKLWLTFAYILQWVCLRSAL